jgi:hypothetical protein
MGPALAERTAYRSPAIHWFAKNNGSRPIGTLEIRAHAYSQRKDDASARDLDIQASLVSGTRRWVWVYPAMNRHATIGSTSGTKTLSVLTSRLAPVGPIPISPMSLRRQRLLP